VSVAPKIKYSEEELIALLRTRDAAGFSYLYDNYSGALFGVLVRMVWEEEVAQDLLQETFVKIWRNYSSYDPQKGRLYTWMLNIARNVAIDYKRSKSFKSNEKNQDIETSVGAVNNAQNTVFNIDRIGLKEMVVKLKPESQQIIEMLYYGGYTQDEAAKELNMPLGTVKTRTRTALMELRKLLE
jgi:RNA polymerase sigma-70 factor (ECF subfamily)